MTVKPTIISDVFIIIRKNRRELSLHFLKAVEYSPEKNKFQKNLAEFYDKTGKIETAIEIYLKILKEKPDDFDVMSSLAKDLHRSG